MLRWEKKERKDEVTVTLLSDKLYDQNKQPDAEENQIYQSTS